MVEFYLAIFLMLVVAWLLGEVFHRAGQPALVGQLLAGVLIGPSILNIVQPTTDLGTVENVALLFIMLMTGLAVQPAKIVAAGPRALIISFIAFVIPFTAGFEVARIFGVGLVSSLTVGLTISITAVPVNAIILMELGLLDSELGTAVIAAGVIDDIISFVVLSMIQQVASGESAAGYADVAVSVVKVAIFLGAVLVGERLLRANSGPLRKWIGARGPPLKAEGSYMTLLLTFTVGVSLLAEWSGIQLVLGAFFAGVLVSDVVGATTLARATDVIKGATFGFFAPVAFAYIGTEMVLSSMEGVLALVATLLVVAVASKLVGGYIGARVARFSPPESVIIGFLMNSRGFIELVIATTAYQTHLIDLTIFSLVVSIGVVTTIISPVASRIAARRLRAIVAAGATQGR